MCQQARFQKASLIRTNVGVLLDVVAARLPPIVVLGPFGFPFLELQSQVMRLLLVGFLCFNVHLED